MAMKYAKKHIDITKTSVLLWIVCGSFPCRFPASFADAEAGEDGGEDVGGGDGAGDGGEVMEGFADVLGHEVARKVGVQAADHSLQGCGCRKQGLVVACVGDNDGLVVVEQGLR